MKQQVPHSLSPPIQFGNDPRPPTRRLTIRNNVGIPFSTLLVLFPSPPLLSVRLFKISLVLIPHKNAVGFPPFFARASNSVLRRCCKTLTEATDLIELQPWIQGTSSLFFFFTFFILGFCFGHFGSSFVFFPSVLKTIHRGSGGSVGYIYNTI